MFGGTVVPSFFPHLEFPIIVCASIKLSSFPKVYNNRQTLFLSEAMHSAHFSRCGSTLHTLDHSLELELPFKIF